MISKTEANKKSEGQTESVEDTIVRLSKLSSLEYEAIREKEAKNLGFRVSVLDSEVSSRRSTNCMDSKEIVTSDEPFSGEFRTTELFDEIETLLNKHMILPPSCSTVLTLWISLTFVYDAFRILPRLAIISPEKRCGKTTLLDIISGLTKKSLLASNISPAAIYRCIEHYAPTLIIDEADTFLVGRNDQIIGILNSGHTKAGAFVIRSTGEEHIPKKFSTWGPLVFASIKGLAGTIMDRSIIISLRRKLQSEKAVRLPISFKESNSLIRQKLTKWGQQAFTSIRDVQIEPPVISNDRAIDNWLPLFTIANQIGETWTNKVTAAYACFNENSEDDETESILLLKDIKFLFDCERIFSSELVHRLSSVEERPWSYDSNSRSFSQSTLAKLLKPFQISSKQLRIGDNKKRGYERKQFKDAFERYIPYKAVLSDTTVQAKQNMECKAVSNGTNSHNVPVKKLSIATNYASCTVVPPNSNKPSQAEIREH